MHTLNSLMDAALKAHSLPSDRQLAKKLGVSASAVSLWRQGRVIKDEHLAALLELSKADPSEALKVRAEQASSKAEIRLWNQMLTRLASAAMLSVMYIM